MIKVINYQDNYSNIIDNEEKNYLGKWDKTSIKDLKDKYAIFKIVLKDDDYAGHLYGKMIGDLFYFDVILIKEQYRNQGIGSYLLKILIDELKKLDCKNIITTAEYIEDNISLEPIIEILI